MRICIYGAGAMGTSLGALLTKEGIACDLVTRNKEHIDALKSRGAVISGAEPVPVSALLPEEMTGKYDFIFLATKQRENDSVCTFLKDFLARNGAIISVQNGFPEGEIAEYFDANRVYGCALSWGAERVGAGEIKVTSTAGYRFALGAFGTGLRLNEIEGILSRVGKVTVGVLTELRFAKLATNASLSTLSAISGLTFGALSRQYKNISLALIREVFAVARAYGCTKLPLNGHDLFKVFGKFGRIALPIAFRPYRDTRSGMLLDLNAGRRCDVDYVAGVVVRAGEYKGVETPLLARAVALVHDVENGLAEIAPESLRLLCD